ncbi:MAG: FapA family protein [Alkalispirochaeta sp.]
MGGSRPQNFDVFYRHGWVYLTVPPPEPGRSAVYADEVQNRMRLLGMPRPRAGVIQEAIAEATGEPRRLVEWPDGERLASTWEVTIADDEMSATMVVTAPKKGAAPPTVDDLVLGLERAGVVFGHDREALGTLISGERYGTPVTVAAGRAPVLGRSRRLEYRFNLNRGKPYLEMPFGRINLKELNFIDNRHAGDLLAVLLPPVQAVDGHTVTGRTIPAARDTATATIPAGQNTTLNSDGSELYAAVDGNVRIRDGLIVVEPIIEVDNVNYETGNIHFDGSVVVAGSVADGFIVEASGTIQVGKSVGRATLRGGENVLLQSGMNGNGDGIIECGGNLFARYVESSTIRCKGTILVEEAIMHSTVVVREHCILNGRRAEFIAGDCLVGGSFWCRKLGNIYDVATRVSVGVPPELMEEYQLSRKELGQGEETIDTLQTKLERIERAIAEGHSDEKFLAAREQLTRDLASARERIAQLRRTVPALKERLDPSTESVVVVEDTMHHGVVVTFGTHEYRPPQTGSHKTVLRMSHGAIHAGGFDPRDPPAISFDQVV